MTNLVDVGQSAWAYVRDPENVGSSGMPTLGLGPGLSKWVLKP